MNYDDEKKVGLKEKVVHEITEFFLIFLYLALFFGSFITYRRLVLRELGISYLHYGFVVVKALVLAKVILVGQYARVTRIFDDRPLIVSTLYKVVWFTLFAVLFDIIEHVAGGFIHGKDLAGAFLEIISAGKYELLARGLIVFLAFVPFFAFRETGRVLGEGRLSAMFFRKSTAANSTPSED